MSMLADRKRKQKWSLNPRGKAWSSDANKFGQKMLEKMGWQQGKGLGANESGITENIKVSYKNDTQGMGYKDSGEQWTEHESNFSALLESLGTDIKKPDEIKVSSLEEKSQTSKARVHYHKFTRGKDLSLYSKKDLANIFGKRDLDEMKKDTQNQNEVQEEQISEGDQTGFFFNRGSMKDYFKGKLSNSVNISSYILNNPVKQDNSESDCDVGRAGFGFKSEENADYANEGKSSDIPKFGKRKNDSENIFTSVKKIKREKVKLSNDCSSSNSTNCYETFSNNDPNSNYEFKSISANSNNYNNLDNIGGKSTKSKRKTGIENIVSFEEESTRKSKKKKKSKNYIHTDVGISNPVFESNTDDNSKNSEILVSTENFEVIRKKPKKVQTNFEGISNPVFKEDKTEVFNDSSMNNSSVENPFEVKIKKKNGKKQGLVNSDDSAFKEASTEIFNANSLKNAPIENPYEVKIKKKKEKKQELMNSDDRIFKKGTTDIFNDNSLKNLNDVKIERKKEKMPELMSSEDPQEETTSETFNINSMKNSPTENAYEDKIKKKKEKKRRLINNDVKEDTVEIFDVNNLKNPAFENPFEVKIKKKKGKKPNLVIQEDAIDSFNGDMKNFPAENPYEVKIKKKKEKKQRLMNGDNPVFREDTNEVYDESMTNSASENPYEIKIKKKKSKKEKLMNDDNAAISNINDADENMTSENGLGNKIRNKSKKCGVSNPIFEDLMKDSLESCEVMHENINKKKKLKKIKKIIEDSSVECQQELPAAAINIYEGDSDVQLTINKNKKSNEQSIENDLSAFQSFIDEDCNLMLNVVSKPCSTKLAKTEQMTSPKVKANNKRRKSVRFSDITQEHIIPNNELLRMMENDYEAGIDNVNFDSLQAHVDENLEGISKTLDMYQAEIENDINEKKQTTFEDIMIGDVQNPHGENEKLEDGTRLKFKYADFESRTPMYQLYKTGAKKAYKHLIKGDIILKFPNTNLHEISGYACDRRKM